jgi:putative CocE/NonD family hydrolase
MSVPFPGIDFGPNWALPIRRLISDWFAHWLKDVPAEPEGGPVSLFVMGANQWREEAEWPLKRAVGLKYYLGAQDRLTAAPGTDAVEEYTYDPRHPVPTKGGAACCDPKIFPWGPMDQRSVEDRPDVLGYVTEPLTEPVEVTGPVKAQIYVSTSAPDTDFTVKLVDVFPSGEARLLTDGILRLRYREGLGRPVLARPGEVYSVTVDAGVTSNVFLPGHRIRIDVSSSNFPKYDRNLNTGGPVADERQVVIARQKVLFGRRYPSHLRLPVVPSK